MPTDIKFEGGGEGVGVSMPWNPDAPRKREDGERGGKTLTLPPGCEWMEAYVAHVVAREKAKHQDKEKGK